MWRSRGNCGRASRRAGHSSTAAVTSATARLVAAAVRWHTGAMNAKAMVLALAALASTGFGPAAQAPKPAAPSKVVVYKSPT